MAKIHNDPSENYKEGKFKAFSLNFLLLSNEKKINMFIVKTFKVRQRVSSTTTRMKTTIELENPWSFEGKS